MLSMAASWLMSQGERGSAGLSGLEVIAGGGGGWKAVVFKLLFFGSYSVCITFNSTVIQLRILKQLIKKRDSENMPILNHSLCFHFFYPTME